MVLGGGGDVGEGEAAGGALVAQAVAVGDDRRVGEAVCRSRGRRWRSGAADGLPGGFAFGFAALCVGFGAFVGAQADYGDAP